MRIAATLLLVLTTVSFAQAQPLAQGAALAVLGPCASAQLRADTLASERAMMHQDLRIAVTNVSARACAIAGYPAVRLLDERGGVLIAAEQFAGEPAAHQFILPPGGRAAFGLRIATGDGATDYRTVPTVAIVPPGGLTALVLRQSVPAAALLEVTSLQPWGGSARSTL